MHPLQHVTSVIAARNFSWYGREMTKQATELPPHDRTTQITFRIPLEWLDRADRLAEKLSYEGHVLSRTDTFRVAIKSGFKQIETDLRDEDRAKKKR